MHARIKAVFKLDLKEIARESGAVIHVAQDRPPSPPQGLIL